MRPLTMLLILPGLIVLGSTALAGTTTYTSSADFFADLAGLPMPSSTLDFEGPGSRTVLSSGDFLGGVLFTYDLGGVDLVVSDVNATTSGAFSLGVDDPGIDVFTAGNEFDLDFSGSVTGGDSLIIKRRLGRVAGVDLDHPKYDYNCDGVVTGGDIASLKPRFGNMAPACP